MVDPTKRHRRQAVPDASTPLLFAQVACCRLENLHATQRHGVPPPAARHDEAPRGRYAASALTASLLHRREGRPAVEAWLVSLRSAGLSPTLELIPAGDEERAVMHHSSGAAGPDDNHVIHSGRRPGADEVWRRQRIVKPILLPLRRGDVDHTGSMTVSAASSLASAADVQPGWGRRSTRETAGLMEVMDGGMGSLLLSC